jgi:iron only hydrogenase large subunit-like protein
MDDILKNKLEEKINNQAAHIKIIENLIQNHKRQITNMRKCLEEKNKMLDALHYVWCDGGCIGGIHRYNAMKDVELTEEIVKKAESNTYRLRTWFINYKFRKLSNDKKNKYFESWRYKIKQILRKIYISL